jgi:hypothetical protein
MGKSVMFFKKSKKVGENQKIKNATKVTFNDIKFDSKLEFYFYKLCIDHGIEVELKPKYILQPKFEFNGEKFREIGMFPDFHLPQYKFIVETKGYQNDGFRNKYKMLMYHFFTNNLNLKYVLIKNRKECEVFISNLIKKNNA